MAGDRATHTDLTALEGNPTERATVECRREPGYVVEVSGGRGLLHASLRAESAPNSLTERAIAHLITAFAALAVAMAAAGFGLAERVRPWLTVVLTLILFGVVYASGLARLSRPADRE